MLNSRQRAQLRGMANGLDPIFQIGKAGIGDRANVPTKCRRLQAAMLFRS